MDKFLIITNVVHTKQNKKYFGYSPYVSEMNIWLKYTKQTTIVAPLKNEVLSAIDLPYDCDNIIFRKVPAFDFKTLKNKFSSIFNLPIIFWRVFVEIRKADHIHLRCPGNIGLIGCIVQIFFPSKVKTAKYAGNWDPKSKQPFTYKLQKYILGNTFLTKNMSVLVYGEWQNQSKNIKSFFTASYLESEKEIIQKTNFDSEIKFIFAGSLATGKNPMYAVKLIEQLLLKGYNVKLDLFGDGLERDSIERYIKINKLNNSIILKGNQNRETLKESYKKSHFVILPSKSEGWPKAIAEGMFWECVPIGTYVSCVPFMLDFGNRGILLEMDLEKDINQILSIITKEDDFLNKSKLARIWSQKYTIEVFEKEIKDLILK